MDPKFLGPGDYDLPGNRELGHAPEVDHPRTIAHEGFEQKIPKFAYGVARIAVQYQVEEVDEPVQVGEFQIFIQSHSLKHGEFLMAGRLVPVYERNPFG